MTTVVGHHCTFFGADFVYSSAIDGDWLRTISGYALCLAGCVDIHRPAPRSIGCVELCLGVMVVANQGAQYFLIDRKGRIRVTGIC